MKKLIFFCQYMLLSLGAQAQFSVGSDAFSVDANTQLSLDGLTLNPSSNLTIVNNTLSISTLPLAGLPPSITKVYGFNSSVAFVGTIGLFYKSGELNGNVEANLAVVHGNGSTIVTTMGSTVDAVNHYVNNLLPSSVNLKIITAATPGALPVSLVYFNAKKEGHLALLSWETAFEKNSDFFEIQRSNDAKNWLVLDKVSSMKNSLSTHIYTYTDIRTEQGSNFYRLKMIDNDGSFAYSTIRSIQFERDFEVISYPNPTIEKITINTAKFHKISSVKLLNNKGQILYESDQRQPVGEIDVRNYPSGVYFLQILPAGGKTRSIKFVKQ